MIAPTMETARLLLRPQQPGDAAVLRLLWEERDPRVPIHRRLTDDGRPTVEDIAESIREAREPRLPTVVRREAGDVIGYAGLVFHGNGRADDPEIAFELLGSVHGHGYAAEAGRAVVAWAASMGHRRLWATVWDWNTASRRVLEKLGFTDSGEVGAMTPHGRTVLTVRDLGDRPSI